MYPSEHEIFGLVPLEALLCGTPVVVADDSGCGEVIASTGGGLVVRGDVEALRSAIAHVLDAGAHWKAAASEAAKRVRATYAPDVVCAQLEQRVRRHGGRVMTGVSFVVPVHNGGPRLAETLASIAAQADGRPMEIIVVEDGSQRRFRGAPAVARRRVRV